MLKYKGLDIPIRRRRFDLAIKKQSVCIASTPTPTSNVGCGELVCPSCIYYRGNLNKSRQYLLDKGYITKATLLEWELSGIIEVNQG